MGPRFRCMFLLSVSTALFYIVSSSELSEPVEPLTLDSSECYTTEENRILHPSCEHKPGTVILVQDLLIGSKPVSTGCPSSNTGQSYNETVCCFPDFEKDCIFSYSYTTSEIHRRYHTSCSGYPRCTQGLPASWANTICNTTGDYFMPQTYYMFFNYSCISDALIYNFNVTMTLTGVYHNVYFQSQGYPNPVAERNFISHIKVTSSNPSSVISVYTIDVRLAGNDTACEERLTFSGRSGDFQRFCNETLDEAFNVTRMDFTQTVDVLYESFSTSRVGFVWIGFSGYNLTIQTSFQRISSTYPTAYPFSSTPNSTPTTYRTPTGSGTSSRSTVKTTNPNGHQTTNTMASSRTTTTETVTPNQSLTTESITSGETPVVTSMPITSRTDRPVTSQKTTTHSATISSSHKSTLQSSSSSYSSMVTTGTSYTTPKTTSATQLLSSSTFKSTETGGTTPKTTRTSMVTSVKTSTPSSSSKSTSSSTSSTSPPTSTVSPVTDTPPPPPPDHEDQNSDDNNSGLGGGPIAGMVFLFLAIVFIIIMCIEDRLHKKPPLPSMHESPSEETLDRAPGPSDVEIEIDPELSIKLQSPTSFDNSRSGEPFLAYVTSFRNFFNSILKSTRRSRYESTQREPLNTSFKHGQRIKTPGKRSNADIIDSAGTPIPSSSASEVISAGRPGSSGRYPISEHSSSPTRSRLGESSSMRREPSRVSFKPGRTVKRGGNTDIDTSQRTNNVNDQTTQVRSNTGTKLPQKVDMRPGATSMYYPKAPFAITVLDDNGACTPTGHTRLDSVSKSTDYDSIQLLEEDADKDESYFLGTMHMSSHRSKAGSHLASRAGRLPPLQENIPEEDPIKAKRNKRKRIIKRDKSVNRDRKDI